MLSQQLSNFRIRKASFVNESLAFVDEDCAWHHMLSMRWSFTGYHLRLPCKYKFLLRMQKMRKNSCVEAEAILTIPKKITKMGDEQQTSLVNDIVFSSVLIRYIFQFKFQIFC